MRGSPTVWSSSASWARRRWPDYYRLADVFVHPALWPEPFPRTLLEALAFDVPLIVSDRGASANVLGKAGTTFPAGDAARLAACLDEVLGSAERKAEMVRLGHQVLGKLLAAKGHGRDRRALPSHPVPVKDII